MLVTGIKSKPVYAPLRADSGGRHHLLLGSGPGTQPLLQVLAQWRQDAPEALARSRVLFVPEAAGDADAGFAAFSAVGVSDVRRHAEPGPLLVEFESLLADAVMGLRLYVAGPESFIGLAMKIALQFNLNTDEIRAQECGSTARRVRCVHCRATTEDVRTNIVECIGCRRWLLVRDHYSRRLAAYMGVMVDAETPGERPAIREVFP